MFDPDYCRRCRITDTPLASYEALSALYSLLMAVPHAAGMMDRRSQPFPEGTPNAPKTPHPGKRHRQSVQSTHEGAATQSSRDRGSSGIAQTASVAPGRTDGKRRYGRSVAKPGLSGRV